MDTNEYLFPVNEQQIKDWCKTLLAEDLPWIKSEKWNRNTGEEDSYEKKGFTSPDIRQSSN